MPEYDDQYALEVARAQRGNGFINANVSDTGEVLSGAYDPSYLNAPSADYRAAATLAQAITRRREEEARAEMRARQFKAQQEFKSLVAGGVAPEMALRSVAADLVPPGQLASTYRSLREPEPKLDLAPMRAEQHILDQENRQRMTEMNTIQRSLNPSSEMDRLLIQGRDTSGLSNRLSQLQGELQQGRSNYLQAAAQAAPQRITTQAQYDSLPPGAIYLTSSGRRARKP